MMAGAAGTASTLAELIAELEDERAGIRRELAEIELLRQQAQTEAERHEMRRTQAAERLAELEKSGAGAPGDLTEQREQVAVQTRRAALMAGQVQVLEGKRKTLDRFQARLDQTLAALPRVAATTGGSAAPAAGRAVLAAQEQMRREIARQMHDGPAQSIANIALQAQVVQRLLRQDVEQAEAELVQLNAMVQRALEATKAFIFDVRPMVLDDLGLVPTLRRAARERAQKIGIPIGFESMGADRRLEPELESTLFRMIDDTLAGYALGRPEALHVRLDWTEGFLLATVYSRAGGTAEKPASRRPEEADAGAEVPAALAAMIADQRAKTGLASGAGGLPPDTWADIRERGASLGLEVSLEEDGRRLTIRASGPA